MFTVLLLHEKQMRYNGLNDAGWRDCWEIHMSKKWKITSDGSVDTTSTVASVVMNAWRSSHKQWNSGSPKNRFQCHKFRILVIFLNFVLPKQKEFSKLTLLLLTNNCPIYRNVNLFFFIHKSFEILNANYYNSTERNDIHRYDDNFKNTIEYRSSYVISLKSHNNRFKCL